MKYNKLVRDKIPERIEKNREIPVTHIASEEEYWEKLKEKLLEETKEFIKEPNEEEFADILEVMDSIKNFKNFDEEEIAKIKKLKLEEKGGFYKRIILDEVKD